MREARSRFSPGSRGRGSDLERGLCPSHPGAPPLPRPPNRLPHSFSPTGCHLRPLLVSSLGVSASGHPNPGVLQCWSLLQDPFGLLSFLQQFKLQYFFWVLPSWGLLHAQFPPIPAPPLPPSLSYTCFLSYHSNVLILFLETVSVEGLIAT